ncbi:MAG: TonB-dependent receptor [Deltaproteobacteria bacterium]|nr:MAG: TonB-dependent receptor [Deltaproteobacteria bacterium]TMB39590.1 MAG: TonB-dependent receptor [Deltaproteobacteria bacterium]
MPPSRTSCRRLLPFAVLLATVARAQEPGETIEVEGNRPEASPRAPAAQTTAIDVRQYAGAVRTVSELLEAAPGVTVHALGGPGQTATLSLRGGTADQSVVLLDGIPLQGPGGGAIDLATVPATLLERITVTRGVVGAQFGAGALGGVVELQPTVAHGNSSLGAQLSAGSFGTMQAAADGTAALNEGSAVVAVQADRTAGGFEFARQLTPEIPNAPYYGFTRQNDDSKRLSAMARVAQPLGAAEIDLLVQGSAGERGLPGPAAATTSRSRELDAGGLAGVRVRGTGDGSAWSVRTWGRLDRIELRGVQSFGDCDDGSPECPRLDQRSSSGAAEAEYGFLAARSHWLRASLQAREDRVHGGDTGSHDRVLLSAALTDDIASGGGFSFHPALRVERVGSKTGVSPAVTASWRPANSESLELRAGSGLSFRAPTFTELYLERNGVAANPGLRPERAWSIDAGGTWRNGGAAISAGVFWSAYRDLIVYEFYPPAKVKPFNVGGARIAGAELQGSVTLPAGFRIDAAYSFLHTVNLREGDQEGHSLSYRPPHRVFVRGARRGDRLEGYFEGRFTSAMPRNPYDTAAQAAQLVFNAGLGVRAAGPLWLDFEAKNLFDDRTLEDVFQYPLPGFSIAVIARARL